MGRYAQEFSRSMADPRGFWGEAASLIDWYAEPASVLDNSAPPFYRWFTGGIMNTCFNALDRHVAGGRGEQAALIYDSPVTGSERVFSYAELLDQVARFAGVLRGAGVGAGDRVVIYLPMIPEAVVAMLACARIGAVHSVVFGGFAAHELALRIDDAAPKVIVSASCGIEVSRVIEYKPMLDRAIELSQHKPDRCVILQRPQATAAMVPGRDVDWREAMAAAEPVDCVPVAATDPLYILYTSGTTAKPKGVVRDNGGHAVALRLEHEAHLRHRRWRGVLGRIGRRLGRRPFLHRLCPAAGRLHDRAVRGQAGRDAGRGGVLAGRRRASASRRCSPRRPRSGRSRRRILPGT